MNVIKRKKKLLLRRFKQRVKPRLINCSWVWNDENQYMSKEMKKCINTITKMLTAEIDKEVLEHILKEVADERN